jgi:hypothetical protein
MRSTTYLFPKEMKGLQSLLRTILTGETDCLQGEVHDETAALCSAEYQEMQDCFQMHDDLYEFMCMMLEKGKYYNPYSRGLKEEKFAQC